MAIPTRGLCPFLSRSRDWWVRKSQVKQNSPPREHDPGEAEGKPATAQHNDDGRTEGWTTHQMWKVQRMKAAVEPPVSAPGPVEFIKNRTRCPINVEPV